MTIALILLGIIVLMGLALGVELLRLSCLAPSTSVPSWSRDHRPDPSVYRPLLRLVSEDDYQFLVARRGLTGAAARRFRRGRARTIAAYLAQMRGDFSRSWSLCRLMAPFSDDPNFGTMLVRQFFLFHGLYVALYVRCVLGVNVRGLDPSRLVDALNELQASAQRALQAGDDLALHGAAS